MGCGFVLQNFFNRLKQLKLGSVPSIAVKIDSLLVPICLFQVSLWSRSVEPGTSVW